jgi:tetrahydrodipicolinate N-acetyltransferase
MSRQPIWVGSKTVLHGRTRITLVAGAALRVGIGQFGLGSRDYPSVIRIRPGGELRGGGIVSLQRGVLVVVDGGPLSLATRRTSMSAAYLVGAVSPPARLT